ncbi:peptide/nickel transport system permease protein [Deinococcus metalli]|uniref:Peptide ABC transporter permease n=1 Tax=Deinococcus metalli TaxID=1141878 RepID=A0A7W8KEA5_9DEIO|nr:ABC transporter permease [Deinococcus metalli]MBB5376599.1 peptide/nickel transport system permease protein [Deinococcus metalli]GHF42877.1 peptide ABC transporter permease [Deinococcus metalli]
MNATHLLKRLLGTVPLLLGVSLLLFGVLHLAPGGPLDVYADNPSVSPEALAQMRTAFGLDQPLPVQYVSWVTAFFTGEWGYSIRTARPVTQEIAERIGPTLILGGTSFVLSLLIALPLGIVSAVRRYSGVDYLITFLSFLGVSMPVFWLALMLQLLFAVQWRLLPSAGIQTIGSDSVLDLIHHLILPACILAFASVAGWSRYMRSSMVEVLGQDYVRTARAKGLTAGRVVVHHALRNALIPIITVVALDFATILSGAVITETIFAWPGIGRLFIESMNGRDYPVLMALMMAGSFALILSNLLADLAYAAVDPRIRYE